MATTAIWGLDIGQCALKAVKARAAGGLVEVLAFDHIEYKKALSTAGVDSSATIREALQTFLSRNDVEDCGFCVSIAAGRAALIRFIKLPPVDRRKVPDIVKYEATQQIPFPLEDVIWDHQVIERTYAPGEELEVGIFAMRREAIFDFLSNLMVSGIEVENIQLSAVALYNCVHFDQPTEDGAVMAVDIGAENTNLVVVDGNSVWTRSLPIGGNDFTRAIATKYSMDFEGAENLKRNMDRSKKAQEIFEALRPSLRSLLDEIQRSAGYYRSLHKSAKFVKLLGFGAGFRMFGVQRFLEAGLAYPVEIFEKTNNILVDGAVNQQFFKKSAPAFGPALGLVVQGLGAGGINTTLMPPTIIRERLLKQKRPFLIAAAAMLAMAFAWPAMSAYTMPVKYDILQDPVSKRILGEIGQQQKYADLTNVVQLQGDIQKMIALKARRVEQLDAFNALVACIPKEQQYPIYIQTIALDSGDEAMINGSLVTPRITNTRETINPFGPPETVRKPNVIGKATVEKTAVTKAKAGMTADERYEKIDARYAKMDEQRSARSEKALVKMSEKKTKGVTGSQRQDLKIKFPDGGTGTIANVYLETADPGGVTYLRGVCQQMKSYPGVVYAECVEATPETYWEDPETHARIYDEPGADRAATFKKVAATTAVMQWVYKRGFTESEVVAKAAGGPKAAAAVEGDSEAADAEAPAGPNNGRTASPAASAPAGEPAAEE